MQSSLVNDRGIFWIFLFLKVPLDVIEPRLVIWSIFNSKEMCRFFEMSDYNVWFVVCPSYFEYG